MPPTIRASSTGAVQCALCLALLLCATVISLPQGVDAALTDGLVGHWTFDGPDTHTTITDRSGQNNDGYFVGGPTSSAKVIGKLGQALRFDGSNDEVLLGTQSYPANFTLTAWMKPAVGSFSLGPSIFGIGNVYFGINPDTSLEFWNNGGAGSGEFSAPVVEGTWQHVAFVYNGTDVRAYVNGASSGSPLTAAISTTFDAAIGSSGTGFQYFKGLLDDVRVYDRALSPTEVKQLYNFGKALQKPPNNLGLVGYWSFNEGSGTVATDFSGNRKHGTLTNMEATDWVSGKRGKALDFDGSDDNIVVPYSSAFSPDNVSFGGWVKADTAAGVSDRVVMGNSELSGGYLMAINGTFFGCAVNSIGIFVRRAGDWCASYSLSNYATSTWHHIFGTYDGETIYVYVDGVQVGSNTNPSGSMDGVAASTPFCVGARPNGTLCDQPTLFDGSVDEVRIYNRALPESEVARLYNSGTVRMNASSVDLQRGSTLATGLVGHWTFDGADTQVTIADRSGQDNHGYFKGGATSSAKIAGKLGQALNFVRANSTRVDMSSDLMASGDRTACVRANLNSISADEFQSIFDTGGFYFLQYYFTGGQYFIFFTSQNSFGDAVLLPSSPIGVWNHICAVRPSAAGNASIYVNGALLGTVDDGAPTAGTSLSIGGHIDSPTTYFNGEIDDARVYNRMLTATEVKQLYNLGTVIIRP